MALVLCLFFELMAAGSLLYSWHARRTTEAKLEPTNSAVQTFENKNKTRMAQKVNIPTEAETPRFVDTPDQTQIL